MKGWTGIVLENSEVNSSVVSVVQCSAWSSPLEIKKVFFHLFDDLFVVIDSCAFLFYTSVILAAVIVLYPPNSIIFKEGWKGQEMFVLVHGR